VELAKGQSIAAVCKMIGITDQTYYRWRKEYGGLKVDQAKRFKELEQENARLKRLLAHAELVGFTTRSPAACGLAFPEASAASPVCAVQCRPTAAGRVRHARRPCPWRK
jgi:hypothetical protein